MPSGILTRGLLQHNVLSFTAVLRQQRDREFGEKGGDGFIYPFKTLITIAATIEEKRNKAESWCRC